MEILISVIAKIAEYTIEPVGRELGYLCFIHKNFEKLKNQVEELKDTRASVQQRVHSAEKNVEDIKLVVRKWLSETDAIVGESEVILANEGGHGRLCSTNLIQLYKISRKARKMADDVHEMKNKGEKFEMVSNGVIVSLEVPKVPDFLHFESRKSTMEQIINALFDVNVHRIGVHGMGGIGKTMLVKEISRKIVENKSFDKVVILTISQTPDMKVIQGELADKLDLKFEQETIKGRALKLQKRLKMEKSILIVLDDVWEPIDFETIGIPSVEDHIGCKLLFTTRDRHLISTEMCVDKIFEIKLLGKEESWKLFNSMSGENVEKCDIKPIATKIVEECAKLPIAITTVAKALKDKPVDSWEDALDQLRRSDDMVVNIRGMDKKVYLSLKLSYDYLECEEVKLLFLLCSMFREDLDIKVKDLQVYAMGLGFLQGVDNVATGRRRITKLVDDLISSSLLLPSEHGNNYVKMHDMVRAVSISIASKHDYIRTLSYVKRENNELKEDKLLGNHTVVSFNIEGLHDPLPKLMFPKVQLLRLDVEPSNGYLSVVETFFEEMKELKGLDLFRVEISLLPPSLYSFANIRLLCLRCCKFGNIDMIGELKRVEILNFSRSNITELPTTLRELTQLKVLDLSYCDELKVIPPNIISKLTKLEELNLNSFDRWEGEEWYEGRKNASLSELKYLPHLCALNLSIQDEEIMPKHLFLEELNLKKFDISIGFERSNRRNFYKKSHMLRKLELKIESRSCFYDWIKTLLKTSDCIRLEGSICSKTLHLELLDANDVSHLKHLRLYDNLQLQHLIHWKNKPLRKFLSNLEDICLEKLENLESIIDGYNGEFAFNKLRDVTVRNCHKLETLFFNFNKDDVLNLENINIRHCKKMEVIISVMGDEEATNNIEFTHLKYLFLNKVPGLHKFFSKNEKVGQLSQHNNSENQGRSRIENENGDSFFTQVSLPNLETLFIDDANNLKMIWSNVLIPNSFSKLKEVDIYSCNNLEKVFPPNMKSLHASLNSLRINSCEKIEAMIIVMENEEATNHIEFTNLKFLSLTWLPQLQKFFSKKEKCRELNGDNSERSTIKNDIGDSFFTEEVSLPNLETLFIDDANNLKMIWSNVLLPNSFSKLKEVHISSCNNLEKVFPPNMKSLHASLNSLSIRSCEKIEAMIIVMENEEATNHIEFTHLKFLYLRCLPRLQKFCSKKEKCRKLSGDNSERSTIKNDIGDSFFTKEVSFPNLEKLEICSADNLKMIWRNVFIPNSFSKLKEVEISSCNNLEKVFSPDMMNLLICLNILRIKKCELLEGIFEVQEPIGVTKTSSLIVLQNLRELTLHDLPNLEYVWNKNPCELMSFVNIESLSIIKCSKLRKEYSVKIVRQLEEVSIDMKQLMKVIEEKETEDDMMESKQLETSKVEITQFQGDSELFPKLKTLKLYGFLDYTSTHLPMKIVQILYQLETFELEGTFIEDIFPIEMLIPMKKLRQLTLSKLPKLRNLWNECLQKNTSLLKELSYLSISKCGALSSLVPSSVSFTNLETLEVHRCHSLTHLLNTSMARTLVQLHSLILSECKRMTTVIGGEAVEGNDEIVFKNLKYLYLISLSKLTSFYSGRDIIKLPCLLLVFIEECSEMKVFSFGIVSTPNLKLENVSFCNDNIYYRSKDSEEMMVEDINVIVQENWENNIDTGIPNLFGEETLEENQCEH